MRDENTILHEEAGVVRDLQQAIRRELNRRQKPLKVVGMDSGIGYSTLLTYFPDEHGTQKPNAMPVAALRRLCGALPPDLLSMLLPDGFQIVRVPEHLNHDEIAEVMADYLAAKQQAHRPDSEEGERIGPNESNVLRGKFAKVKAA